MPQKRHQVVKGHDVILGGYENAYGRMEYTVRVDGEIIGPKHATRADADRLFDRVVENIKKHNQARTPGNFDETVGARSAYSSSGGFRPLEDDL